MSSSLEHTLESFAAKVKVVAHDLNVAGTILAEGAAGRYDGACIDDAALALHETRDVLAIFAEQYDSFADAPPPLEKVRASYVERVRAS